MLKWTATASLALSLTCAALAQLDGSQTVMVVNGEEIKAAEYFRRMEFLGGVGRMVGGQFASSPPGFLTLQRLLDERIVLQIAAERGVMPTAQELKAELAERLQDDPQLVEAWKAQGLTEAELDYQIKLDLAQFKIQTQGITITDLEVEKYYKDNPAMFTMPKQYKLRLIAVDNEDQKKAVDAELAKGTAFAEVAKKLSVDVSKVSGGDLPPLTEDNLGEALKKALTDVKIGQSSDWVTSSGSSYKFFLENIIPEKKDEYNDKLKRFVRKKLMLDRGRIKVDLDKEIVLARSKAKVEIRRTGFSKSFEEYLKNSKGG